MENLKITAVVVTYNRLPYLKLCIDALRGQSRKLDNILVVNNGSTDGTKEWLDTQRDLQIIHQENGGGSFGFYTGVKTAYEQGFDFIWSMDDDVRPRESCLEELLACDSENIGIMCPARIMQGELYVNEKRLLNLNSVFGTPTLLQPSDVVGDAPIKIEGMTFEGPLIKREVVKKIGFPNKDLFILFDDTDYSCRAVNAGFEVLYVPKAIMDKEYFPAPTKEEFVRKNKWKVWYYIRNGTYFYHTYGKNFAIRYMWGLKSAFYTFGSICVNYFRNKKYEFSDFSKPIRMFFRGICGKLGKM